MKIKDGFKPIPKYMLKKIKAYDLEHYSTQDGHTRFYAYLTKFKKQLVKVIVAVRNYRNKWLCKQVVLHGIHSSKCYVNDIVFYRSAGYKVGWYLQGVGHYQKWFEDGCWGWNDDKYFNIPCHILNKEFIKTFPEYKYSAVDLYQRYDVLNYLRLYEQYPHIELLMKLGLTNIATSTQILKLSAKDKKFRKWLIDNKDEVNKYYYYISTIIKAYKQNKSLKETQTLERFRKGLMSQKCYKEIKSVFGQNLGKFYDYYNKTNVNLTSYKDYVVACKRLKIDMNLDKNRIPHDFKKWHDIRIDEYNSRKLEFDAEDKQEFYNKFAKIANKYLSLQRNMKEDYIMIIAKSPADLINEGTTLHHCVGKSNYDQKFAREESLIFFVRNKDNPQIPFVTVEYSLENKKVLQCYGEYDHKPDENVLKFVNKVWLPYANRKLKKVA